VAVEETQRRARFDPASYGSFRFVGREIDERGAIKLRYALDEEIEFVEEFDLPSGTRVSAEDRRRIDGLLSLLHWVAGVSYFKTAVPEEVRCESGPPPAAAAALLEALYSEGLGEFAFVNGLRALPRPGFRGGAVAASTADHGRQPDSRVLVPVGGGKDSIVALETMRRSGRELVLFSVGNASAIARTAGVSGLPHLIAQRRLDPGLGALNDAGALNGHVPITAIVACVALLSAALHGCGSVAMANERSASVGNLRWDGIDVNHQFSKSLRAEHLLRAAVAEVAPGLEIFSVLRPASELAIARAFARLPAYHSAFTSCNAIFRLDPALRTASWCCDCPKCRFVFLILAPFSDPGHLEAVFGCDMLADERQFGGFALLTATGGNKPFECVGEEEESLAAIRMLAEDPRWREHSVIRRLVADVVPGFPADAGSPEATLALSEDHAVPAALMADVRAILGA
jgi:UDP-N-acetyl-alpha-D-muramoyl-L-alanyl-L-glutamate epimerase